MAAQAHSQQPAAKQISSNHQPQKLVVDRTENIVDNSKDILKVSNSRNLTAEATKFSSAVDDRQQIWWNLVLDKICSFLSKSLSDWTLIKTISVVLLLILSISVNVLPSRAENEVSSESAEIISIPKQEIEIVVDSTTTDESETSSSETISIPEQEIEVVVDSTATDELVSTPVEIETPQTLVAPQKPESLTITTIAPPEPILTPEQIFASKIQTKISEITSQYGDELIVSGKADLLNLHLRLKVNDDWYQLSKSRQDQFANEIFKRSQKFNFSQLEIQDSQNNLVARSPIVGNQMIILQRAN